MKKLFFLLMAISVVSTGKTQCTFAESFKAQLVQDWESAKVLTNQYLDIVPADKYSFKAQDSIRSFAQHMLHLAQANSGMVSNGTGVSRLFRGIRLDQSLTAQAKDSVVYYVNASYDFAIKAIKGMDLLKLEEKVKDRTMEETRFAWLLKAFAHQTHHRGQTVIYIRLVGIKPPKWLE